MEDEATAPPRGPPPGVLLVPLGEEGIQLALTLPLGLPAEVPAEPGRARLMRGRGWVAVSARGPVGKPFLAGEGQGVVATAVASERAGLVRVLGLRLGNRCFFIGRGRPYVLTIQAATCVDILQVGLGREVLGSHLGPETECPQVAEPHVRGRLGTGGHRVVPPAHIDVLQEHGAGSRGPGHVPR